MTEKKVWFVTGAGRGMGVEIAKAALAAGNAVGATGRNTDAMAKAVGEADDLLVVKLDITSSADAEAAVRAVFDEHPEWFRLRPRVDAFRLVRSYSRGWLRYLRFEQAYKGIPVGGAGYEARVVSNGRVGTIEGRFHSDIAINVTPVLGPDQAEDRARDLFRPGTTPPSLPRLDFESLSRFDGSRALVIVPQGQSYVLAWGVVIQTSPPSIQSTYSRVYIDASTGAPLGVDVAGSSQPRPR